MKVSVETLEKSQAKLTIEVSVEELAPYVDAAAKRISNEVTVKGFRKGHVPLDVMKQHVGEATIYEEAFQQVVEKTYPQAVEQEDLHVVGRANIDVEKIAPGNPIVYTAIVPLMPKIELGEYTKLKAKRSKAEMDDKKFEKTMDELRRLRSKEKLVDRPAKTGDTVVIDFDVKVDGVSIEGGQAQKSRLSLGSGQFIPGFEDGVVGMKKGEKKVVDAKFPEEYFKKDLAGKEAKADVTLHDVYEIELPEMNDELAKELNFESLEKLNEEIRSNIMKELQEEADRDFEVAAIQEVVKGSKIDPIPEQLIDEEVEKMFNELKYDIINKGMQFEDYLTHMQKTEEDLKVDFREKAVERIQAALVLRELAVAEKLEITQADVDADIEETRKVYEQYPEMMTQFENPAYRARVENMLMNKKVFDFLAGEAAEVQAK